MPALPFPSDRTGPLPSQSPQRSPSARYAFPAAAPSIHSSVPPSHAPAFAIAARSPQTPQPPARFPQPARIAMLGSAGILPAGGSTALRKILEISFSWLALLFVLRHQRRHSPILGSKIFFRHALHIFLRHRAVILRRIKEFPVIPKKHLIRPQSVGPPINRPHLPVKLRQPEILRLLQLPVRNGRTLQPLHLFVNRFLTRLRIYAF